jgi:hypothetical protein
MDHARRASTRDATVARPKAATMIHQPDISQAPDDGSRTARISSPWIVVTGLDGAGKTTLVERLESSCAASSFRLPYHDFVHPCLARSGAGEPFGDVQTDRLLFSLDARLANYQIRDWRREGRTLISQRGWMDNFIFGAVQGLSYRQTDEMLQKLRTGTAVGAYLPRQRSLHRV